MEERKDVEDIVDEIREKTRSKLRPISITKTERLKKITEEKNINTETTDPKPHKYKELLPQINTENTEKYNE